MTRTMLFPAVTIGILAAALAGSIGWVYASGGPEDSMQRSERTWDDSGADSYRHGRTGRASALHFLLRDNASSLR